MPSNLDPEKIPDMSLPDRADPPAKPDAASAYQSNAVPMPVPDVALSYQLNPVPVKPTPPMEPAAPHLWEEGDRVLAPWEPMFLYAGTIKQIKIDDARGDQALVQFDDGDDGWVFLFSLCPLDVKEGEKVLSRRKMGPQYYHCEILEVAGEDIHIRFEDGSREWTTLAALRIPCIENGPGAVGTRFGSNRLPEITNPQGTGIPSWVWSVGLIILLAFLRIGCRAMLANH